MTELNWSAFTLLSGSQEANFETLCRAVIRRQYGQYGDFVALASQPGVEFHLKLRIACTLGQPGRWYGWQCRWYDLASGHPIGNARKQKIKKAIATTERVLPGLTDWILWTRYPLTKRDQEWFYALKTRMQLHLWTAHELEEHLSGVNEIFRRTYFGELGLTTETLATLHNLSIAPIRRRWVPQVHQPLDAERSVRRMLGESGSWGHLEQLADRLRATAEDIRPDVYKAGSLADTVSELLDLTIRCADSLSHVFSDLNRGDLDLLRQHLMSHAAVSGPKLNNLPRQLRSARCPLALLATNAIADCRLTNDFINEVESLLGEKLVAILADAGCGKTQLAAQLTVARDGRPCGVLLLGKDLHTSHNLDDIARRVVIHGVPITSMEALIAAVDAAGQRAQRRLPIVIDGLNEAEDARIWKSLLATLQETLTPYAHVLVVCTVRTPFEKEALPEELTRLQIPDFGRDSLKAIRRYFAYYRINARDAEIPIGLLRHPLTLRLFCEVTNPSRQHEVGIEAMPQSLTALFDRYLAQAAERIADLALHTHRYYEQDVRSALDEIGTMLWQEKVRNVDLGTLRNRLGDTARPWNASIVNALEQEGILLRYPGEGTTGPTVAGVYDALAGHLIASAILSRLGREGFEGWLKDPGTMRMLKGPLPDQHPLAFDTFRALVGLVPRRLYSQQLWALIDTPFQTTALRAAADLEAAFLDASTVGELRNLAVQTPTDERDIFDRLRQTRGAQSHPLNADFLDSVLRPMTVANRDLRWTEWIRRNHEEVIADVGRMEERWRHGPARSVAERLRARWIMWTLCSTVRELRDRATRTLYWYGRGDPARLFQMTLQSLAINDPYVSERTLAASYGVCMALHCRPRHVLFRAKLLPTFAKGLYRQMFAQGAPHSTTHALSRDYARRITDLARLHDPSVLSRGQWNRTIPPYKDGGLRQWQSITDPNDGKYRDGNSPFGMDFENYTIGRLVRSRRNYDYENEEYKQVVGQITWRIYELGYSLEKFGEIDKAIANTRYFGRAERPRVERYGKKYARIAYFEQYGLRQDNGLLDNEWHEPADRPSDADIDPSFPSKPHRARLVEDFLGERSVPVRDWVERGPTPKFSPYLVRPSVNRVPGPWIMLDGHCSQQDKSAERTGFVMIRSFLLLNEDVNEFIRLMKKETPKGRWLPEEGEDHYTFAGEIPWCDTFPHNELTTVDFVIGTTRVPISPTDIRYSLRLRFGLGGTEQTVEPRKSPEFEEVNKYRKVVAYIPVRQNSFSSGAGIERPSAIVPAKELLNHFALWPKLPSWDMYDQKGARSSIIIADGEFLDYERHLFFKKELIDNLLASQKLSLIWVAWGQRQHFSQRSVLTKSSSHGYHYFQQVYRYTPQGKAKSE